MKITIDTENSMSIYSQLITQIKQVIQNGEIKPGDQLPSIRQLANDLEINPKTVAKAYRFLERDCVIQSKGYKGSFVHANAVANSTIDLNGWMIKLLSKNITAFREAGLTDTEIRTAFTHVLNQIKGP